MRRPIEERVPENLLRPRRKHHRRQQLARQANRTDKWGLQEEWLARAFPVLDIYHVLERLWKAADCFHQDGSRDAEDFVTHSPRMLLDGKVGYVVGSFRRLSHQLAGSQKRDLRKSIQFFCNNRDYMHYVVPRHSRKIQRVSINVMIAAKGR